MGGFVLIIVFQLTGIPPKTPPTVADGEDKVWFISSLVPKGLRERVQLARVWSCNKYGHEILTSSEGSLSWP